MSVSSTFLEFMADRDLGFTMLSEILLPMNSFIALAIIWATYLEAVFRASSTDFVAVRNIFFRIC